MIKILVLHTEGPFPCQRIMMVGSAKTLIIPWTMGLDLDNLELTVLDFLILPTYHNPTTCWIFTKNQGNSVNMMVSSLMMWYPGRNSLLPRYHGRPWDSTVLTGAMRSSNEFRSDGSDATIYQPLRVASDDKAVDKGILVVMNDEIHAAKCVTKTHTTNVVPSTRLPKRRNEKRTGIVPSCHGRR